LYAVGLYIGTERLLRVDTGRLVTLKSRTNSPVAQLFIECVRELAKPLANKK
jgi:hypothetical protein